MRVTEAESPDSELDMENVMEVMEQWKGVVKGKKTRLMIELSGKDDEAGAGEEI